jgi:hypothetical protein
METVISNEAVVVSVAGSAYDGMLTEPRHLQALDEEILLSPPNFILQPLHTSLCTLRRSPFSPSILQIKIVFKSERKTFSPILTFLNSFQAVTKRNYNRVIHTIRLKVKS